MPLDTLASDAPFEGELTLLTEIVLPPSGFYDPAFVPSGSDLIIRYGLALRRFNLRTGQLAAEISPPVDSNIGVFRIAPSGDYVVIADGGDLVVVDLVSGELLHRLKATTGYTFGMSFSSLGDLLVTADDRGWLTVWNTETWQPVSKFRDPTAGSGQKTIEQLGFLKGRSQIALEGVAGHVQVLDLDGNLITDTYIGSRGELQLESEAGGSIVLGKERNFMVLDAQGTSIAGIRISREDCLNPETPTLRLEILDSDGERTGCQYIEDSGTYQVLNNQGQLLGTVMVQARRITFRNGEGEVLGVVRMEYFGFPGATVTVLDDDGEAGESEQLDDGYLLSLLPNGHSAAVYEGVQLLCIDLESGVVTCSIPFSEPDTIFSRSGSSFPDGYWLATDLEGRLRLFDLSKGSEVFRSQPLEFSNIKGVALSGDRAFVALIITKPDATNSFLQIWGYPAFEQ